MAYEPPKRDATVCHWCREKFEPGQVRYIIDDEIEAHPGWERVPICGLCWKEYGPQSAPNEPRERFERACGGCGEPMMIPGSGQYREGWRYLSGWHDYVCSNRCHQRARRKLNRPQLKCSTCKKPFTAARADACYCSNACRQWTYRQRKHTATNHRDRAA